MTIAEDILNRAIALGSSKSSEASTAASAATTAAQGFALLNAPLLSAPPAVVEPPVHIPMNATGVDSALFSATNDGIVQMLADKFAAFFTQYFPMEPALIRGVEDWLSRAINEGGTGINAAVENQLWQRDRDRLTRAASTSEQEATGFWAAKGFPLPPGAASAAVQQIRRDRDGKLAEASRDRAIKTFEQEIENVRFAITAAIDYRVRAIASAGDYIRVLALGPQLAVQLATSASNAQANLISAASSYYNARIKVAELKFTPDRLNAEMTLRAGEKTLDGFESSLRTKASTAVAIAQSLGQQAASALNAVNGTVQLIRQIES